MNASIGRNADERKRFNEILRQIQDTKLLLKLMREETALLVLMVRIRQQEKREARLDRQWETEDLFAETEGN